MYRRSRRRAGHESILFRLFGDDFGSTSDRNSPLSPGARDGFMHRHGAERRGAGGKRSGAGCRAAGRQGHHAVRPAASATGFCAIPGGRWIFRRNVTLALTLVRNRRPDNAIGRNPVWAGLRGMTAAPGQRGAEGFPAWRLPPPPPGAWPAKGVRRGPAALCG